MRGEVVMEVRTEKTTVNSLRKAFALTPLLGDRLTALAAGPPDGKSSRQRQSGTQVALGLANVTRV